LIDSDAADLPHHQILVNLSPAVPACFAQFERMIEVVASDGADTEAGRQRYGHYRQRGYTLTHSAAKKA
jgi:DNA polymerase-3 subunit chi